MTSVVFRIFKTFTVCMEETHILRALTIHYSERSLYVLTDEAVSEKFARCFNHLFANLTVIYIKQLSLTIYKCLDCEICHLDTLAKCLNQEMPYRPKSLKL